MARVPQSMDFDHFTYANGDVDIFRRSGSVWALWALVRDSVAVPNGGKGLFAARSFPKGACIGRYVGHIMGKKSNPTVMALVDRVSHTVQGDAIVDVNGYYVDGRRPAQSNEEQREKFGRVIFTQPNWTWPGVYAHIANDSQGTGMINNAKVTPGGYMIADKHIPAYNFSRPHSQNGASEILWSYGRGYWKEASRLGTASMPYLID